ncbi:MAG: glycosyltransferase [Candidatus Woesearchaeota archaeon]
MDYLKEFVEKSQLEKIRGNLIAALLQGAKVVSDDRTVFLREAMKAIEKQGKITLPESAQKDFEAEKKQETKQIKKEIDQLEEIKKRVKEQLEYCINFINKVELFNEEEGFFWHNDREKSLNYTKVEHILSLKFDRHKLKDLDNEIQKLCEIIGDKESYTNIADNTQKLMQNMDYFFRVLLTILAVHKDRKGLSQEEITKHEDVKEQIKNPQLAIQLNQCLAAIRQELTAIKQKLDPLINQLETQLSTQKANLETATQNKPGEHTKQHISNQDKKRILMLTHEFRKRSAGGVQTVVQNLTKNLIKQGFTVDVIERACEGSQSGRFFYHMDSSQSAYSFTDMSDFLNTYPYLTLGLLHLQSINFAAGMYGWHNGGLDELKNIYKGIPVICTIHSLVRHEATLYEADWQPHSSDCQDETIKASDQFIVLHKFGKRLLQEYYGIPDAKIHIIPNGITVHSRFIDIFEDVKNKTQRLFNQKLTLLYVGRISHEKGLFELIEALALIRDEWDAQLIIVGPIKKHDNYYNSLIELINQKNLTNHVTFTDQINADDQFAKVYSRFKPDFAVMPSHHESFPMFALEAISHGVPLIISDVDGPREIYKPYRQTQSPDQERPKNTTQHIENPPPGFSKPLAIACDPKKPESIRQAVRWAVQHPHEVHTMLKNAMHEVREKYTWQKIAESTGKLYNDVLEGRSHVSQYGDAHNLLLEMREGSGMKEPLKQAKIGIIGHFKNKDGSVPDGVARYDENIFSYLRQKDYSVEGYAFVGAARNTGGIVHFAPARELDQLISESDMKVALFHGAEEHANTTISVCRENGIPIVFCMPYWGVWKGIYDFAFKADLLITPLRDYSKKIQAKTQRPVMYIPFPIDTDYWKPLKSDYCRQLVPSFEDSFIIGYVGRLGTSKNLHLLIQPFKQFILDEGLEIKLLICGPPEGDRGELLKQEIQRLGVQEHVQYIERTFSSEEVRKLYNSFNAFIFPSSFESYGLSNLEAISCGVPTVAPISTSFSNYSVPSMVNLPGYPFGFEAGHLYDEDGNLKKDGVVHDWESCFDIIKKIHNNPNEAGKVMQTWSKFVHDNMSLQAVGKQIEEALEFAYLKGSS